MHVVYSSVLSEFAAVVQAKKGTCLGMQTADGIRGNKGFREYTMTSLVPKATRVLRKGRVTRNHQLFPWKDPGLWNGRIQVPCDRDGSGHIEWSLHL